MVATFLPTSFQKPSICQKETHVYLLRIHPFCPFQLSRMGRNDSLLTCRLNQGFGRRGEKGYRGKKDPNGFWGLINHLCDGQRNWRWGVVEWVWESVIVVYQWISITVPWKVSKKSCFLMILSCQKRYYSKIGPQGSLHLLSLIKVPMTPPLL